MVGGSGNMFVSVQWSECQSGEKFKQTRVNGGSICDSLLVTSSECQSNGNLKQAWRDDLEEVNALLFRFLGYGFRLAMSNVGWLVTEVRRSGARSHRLRAVAGAARSRRAL